MSYFFFLTSPAPASMSGFSLGGVVVVGDGKKVAWIAILNGNLANEISIYTATPPR